MSIHGRTLRLNKRRRHCFTSPRGEHQESYTVGYCQVCHNQKRLTKHHKTPKIKGGTNRKGNILLVCRKCHDDIHGMQKKGDNDVCSKHSEQSAKVAN